MEMFIYRTKKVIEELIALVIVLAFADLGKVIILFYRLFSDLFLGTNFAGQSY